MLPKRRRTDNLMMPGRRGGNLRNLAEFIDGVIAYVRKIGLGAKRQRNAERGLIRPVRRRPGSVFR